MEFGLIWKLLIFPIIFGIHRLLMAIDQNCCGSKCYPIKRSINEDLEIDEKKGRLFKQWAYIMYRDKNPIMQYLRCQLCNESFNIFETIVLQPKCELRENDDEGVEPHYFHVCCIDIIAKEHKYEDPIYK